MTDEEIAEIHDREDWNSIRKFFYLTWKESPISFFVPWMWIWYGPILMILLYNELILGYDCYTQTYK